MLDHEQIQTYAQKLAEQGAFLPMVLLYVGFKLNEQRLNLTYTPQSPASGEGFIVDRQVIQNLEQHFADYLSKPDFWEESAAAILRHLSIEQNALLKDGGGLASRFNDPAFSPNFAVREAQARDSYALIAAESLLEQLDLPNLSLEALEKLLGLNIMRTQAQQASYKLSQLQKKVLLKLLEESKKSGDTRFLWTPAKWFGASASKRAVLSRSLKSLEKRNLILSKSSTGERVPDRTAVIELTHLGYELAKLLTSTNLSNKV